MLSMETTSQCRNCGAATTGNYCHMCGQETRLHAPSFGEFMHEFIGHYVALEGKLWGSITRLLFRPGLLTTEYLAGRRKRYVEPLRLYLSLSILFFAVLKLSQVEMVRFDEAPAAVQQRAEKGEPDIVVLDTLKSRAPAIAQSLEHFGDMPAEAKGKALGAAFFSYGPYAMFLMMPVFALWLKLLYLGGGRRYGEHFLFGLHTNAFAFALLGAVILVPVGLIKFALICWLLGYLPWAMQRVYRKGRLGTAWRWLLLIVLHTLSLALGILMVLALGVVTAH
jgi:hypothetical protein